MDVELLKLRERVLIARQERKPLRLHGAGTKDFYGDGAPSDGASDESVSGTPLDLSTYRGIVAYEPCEVVFTARCGAPLYEIETALA